MAEDILTVTVSQLNNYIKRVLENNSYLKNIWIKGEISNFKLHYSGHIYLTLKDEGAVVKAVMFKSVVKTLRFSPENGMRILARGRVSVYERGGAYQLYIEEMQPDGIGALHIAYEQLKEKLGEEGLFDERWKKPLPAYPERIGVVTASTGAAVRDIINVLTRRYPLAEINIFPVLVQGAQAAPQIVDAISFFNEHNLADVLIVGRGGGSIEDLWAFNEESVARAIFSSDIPLISAVGHETDFTIADFVADLRAPTPSAAAELAVPSALQINERIISGNTRILLAMKKKLETCCKTLEQLKNASVFTRFGNMISDNQLYVDSLQKNLEKNISSMLLLKREKLGAFLGKLDALSPLKVLARGYSIALKKDGKVMKSVNDANKGDTIQLRLTDGELNCEII